MSTRLSQDGTKKEVHTIVLQLGPVEERVNHVDSARGRRNAWVVCLQEEC